MGTTPAQRIWQDRFEALIGFAAPALDLVLNAGERVSRVLSPEDRDYYPIRPAGQTFELGAARSAQKRPPAAPVD